MPTVPFTRRRFVSALAAGSVAAAFPWARAADAPKAAWRNYSKLTVIDALGGPGSANKPGKPLDAADLADVRASGITAVNLTVSGVGSYAHDYDKTIAQIAQCDREITLHPDVLMKFNDARDFALAKRSGKLAIIYGFQDATPLAEDLDRLEIFRGLGVRIIQLTYNRRNLVGDGCLEPGNAGLSQFGKTLVERMNAANMLVDLSHCGQRTTHEGIEASKRPVAITHSGCAAVNDTPRNKRDEELKLLAQHGGVIGIYIMPYLRPRGQVVAEDVIRHIEYAVNVCGEDHVGIGTDGFTSATDITPEFRKIFAEQVEQRRTLGIGAPGESPDSYTFATDLNTPLRFERIALLLSQRGHSDARIEKILGGNFARLFRDVIV